MTAPLTHVDNAQKLESDAFINLYELRLFPYPAAGVMRFCDVNTVTWQGNTYSFWGMKFSGDGSNSDGKTVRPQLQLANFVYNDSGDPIKGVFTALHADKKVEGASLLRYRLLKNDADNNNNVFQQMQWRVSRVVSITDTAIGLEMRNVLDAPRFQIPSRQFIPPEFTQVSLG